MWPSSAAAPSRAAVDLAAEQQPAADAGAEREHHRVPRPARGAAAVLGEHRHVRVVVHEHGQAKPLAHQVAERHAVERQVVRHHHRAACRAHQRGDAEADDLRVRSGGAGLLDGVDEDVEQLLLGRARGCAGGRDGGPPEPRRPRLPAASCPRRRCRSRAVSACANAIHNIVTDGDPGGPPEFGGPRDGRQEGAQPEYKLYRSRRRLRDRFTLARRPLGAAAARARACAGPARPPRRGRAYWIKRGAQVARDRGRSAGCCCRSSSS